MVLDFVLWERQTLSDAGLCAATDKRQIRDTHKVVLAAQPLGPLLLQQALQQVSGRVGDVGLELQRLVEDVVVHLGRVAAVERRLQTVGGTCSDSGKVGKVRKIPGSVAG